MGVRPRKPCRVLAAAAVITVLSVAGCGAGQTETRAKVVRVVDGDTIVVDTPDGRERVRYIGIDTPESVKPDTPVQCWAKRAAALNGELVTGRTVVLRFDRERRDRYGRLLAYPYREDGLDVGAELVRRGAARTLEIAPNTAHAGKLSALEAEARSRPAGLWRDCRPGLSGGGSLLRSTG